MFPIRAVVKKGGSDTSKKLYFPDHGDEWLFTYDCDKVCIHIDSNTITSPTKGEWHNHNSFNSKKLSSFLNNNGFRLDQCVQFVCIVTENRFIHLVSIH